MNPRIPLLALAATLPLLGRAADCEGDLRDVVVVDRPAGRLTFAGIGVGSAREEASRKFERPDSWVPRRFVADFGTELEVLVSYDFRRVESMALTYWGSETAARRLFARWKEVFTSAGADCADRSCFWKKNDEGQMNATLLLDLAQATPQVHVTIGN